jgi:photosystem II stability/assembly factor-like uncharacterized protein
MDYTQAGGPEAAKISRNLSRTSPGGKFQLKALGAGSRENRLRKLIHRRWGCWAVLWLALVAPAALAESGFDPSDSTSWVIPRADLYGVDARGELVWAVGYWGAAMRSTDAGRSWSPVATPTDETLYAVAFADESNGWAVGAHGTLLRTTDGGVTWSSLRVMVSDDFGDEQPLDTSLFDVSAVSANEAWVVGDFGVILHTRNGRDWSRVRIAEETFADDNLPDRIFNAVDFTDPEHGWVAGEFGTLLRTLDGGETWTGERSLVGSVEDVYMMDLAATPDGAAVTVGIGGVVLKTLDGGATWTTAPVATGAGLFGVARRDSRAILVGDRGVIFVTGDGGETWSEPSRPRLFNWLRAAAFGPGSLAYIVGENGAVLRSEDGGASWQKSAGEEPPPLEGISVPDPSRSTEPGRADTARDEP